ncbi:MAG: cobalamin B12-binding domain-containing protein [Acidobacteria bacterium]|nr:cobalamin B12-binding domain-containing protein [Acidobacteriota bacterium]
MKRVLLTTVCRPLGPRHGDAPSVGYELLHCQVTRAQGIFSPRSHHIQFALDYLAENLDAPSTVLQYPTKRELIRELKAGYDVVAVSFLVATYHRLKEVVAAIRRYAPGAEIVLGGYGTVLADEMLRPLGDHICREEGVAFMRRLLGEPPIEMPYRHPLIVNPLRIFGAKVSETGVVFAGLGCPNGCDFCCTSHFFKRKHIRLLPTGQDIHRVVDRYRALDPKLSIIILDEDFLLNRKRAMEFREAVMSSGKVPSIFCFASIKALSQYDVTEVLEMGIDGLWIGYEGTRSGYAKQNGRPVEEIFREYREHGVTILASMIVGFPYQTPDVIDEEQKGLLALEPALTQYMIYGPTPGTPFYERVVREGLLHDDVAADPELFCLKGSGFYSLVKHPAMSADEIEAAQARCFRTDFRTLGPSIYRTLEAWHNGWTKLRESKSPTLRLKADRFAREIRKAYPIFLAGKLFGPTRAVRARIAELERRVHESFGAPGKSERLRSWLAVGMAAWTSVTLRIDRLQHPKLIRRTYRMNPPDIAELLGIDAAGMGSSPETALPGG